MSPQNITRITAVELALPLWGKYGGLREKLRLDLSTQNVAEANPQRACGSCVCRFPLGS